MNHYLIEQHATRPLSSKAVEIDVAIGAGNPERFILQLKVE
jgi:hypothetical protein